MTNLIKQKLKLKSKLTNQDTVAFQKLGKVSSECAELILNSKMKCKTITNILNKANLFNDFFAS